MCISACITCEHLFILFLLYFYDIHESTNSLSGQWEKMEASNHLVEEDGYRIWVGLARGLHNADRYGKSDPYAIVKIGGREVFRTHVIDDR